MKIKVGDRVYDANDEPVMVILSDKDKMNIRDMDPEATKYCGYPDGMAEAKVEAFMKTD